MGGTFTYTPDGGSPACGASPTATDADKTDSFTVTATDELGAGTSTTVTVAILPADTAPTLSVTTGSPGLFDRCGDRDGLGCRCRW